jgi:hypothetical protein
MTLSDTGAADAASPGDDLRARFIEALARRGLQGQFDEDGRLFACRDFSNAKIQRTSARFNWDEVTDRVEHIADMLARWLDREGAAHV